MSDKRIVCSSCEKAPTCQHTGGGECEPVERQASTIEIEHTCPMCGKSHSVEVDRVKYFRWQAGELIQNVWPEKTPAARELIKTGLCLKCQSILFAPPED